MKDPPFQQIENEFVEKTSKRDSRVTDDPKNKEVISFFDILCYGVWFRDY